MPLSCAAARPSASCEASRTVSSTCKGPFASRERGLDPPKPEIVDGDDVGVVEGACSTRLLFESADDTLVMRTRGKHLDGHAPPQLGIVGGEYPAHAPAAQLAFDAIAAVDAGARSE